MASPYPGAVQVGSYFVEQYYNVLQQHPDLVHQFYSEGSTMVRVQGASTETASSMLQIHSMLTSLNVTAIEIKTINSLESWNGGVLLMVSGSVKTKNYSGRRKFVQTFFLAPQEKGYFVLNDIFHFIDDGVVYQDLAPPLSDKKVDGPVSMSRPVPDPPVSDYVLEEEARDYVDSVHIEDDTVDKYSLPEQPQEEDVEAEILVEETPAEEILTLHHNVPNTLPEHPTATETAEEPVEELPKRTYASILRVAKEHPTHSVSSINTQTSYSKSAQSDADRNHVPEPTNQQTHYASADLPESIPEVAEESLGPEEGEFKSVYVRNLPSDVTAAEIEEEFKTFGIIKPDGIFIRNRKDVVGVCYAFVEFEDMVAVQNAIKASPIQLAGRQVYIEERRPNSSGTRGGRRGRGRSVFQPESTRGRFGLRGLGRGGYQEVDYKPRGNGLHQRGSR